MEYKQDSDGCLRELPSSEDDNLILRMDTALRDIIFVYKP
jgi:hypothetical protein